MFLLIRIHIVDKHEVYAKAQLHNFYEQLRAARETKFNLSSINLKNNLIEKFQDNLNFSNSNYFFVIITLL